MASSEKQTQRTVEEALEALEDWLRLHTLVTQQLQHEVDRLRKGAPRDDDRPHEH
jgi:hypothetical protein